MKIWRRGCGPAAAVAGAYLIGGFNAGYYIVRRARGVDIRETGSGSTGGTNVARMLGPWARPVVGGLDVAKGAAVVVAARAGGLGPGAQGAVVFAVTLGNVFPVQLGFRGGKGIGTSLGALGAMSPRTAGLIGLLTLGLGRLTRREQASGVLAYAAAGVAAPRLVDSRWGALAVAATATLVIYANRANLAAEIRNARGDFPPS